MYIDSMKAIDTVPHRRLLYKLNHYGIRGKILEWIKSFLMHRKKQVVIKEAKSEWKEVMSLIPQGSVLGPILFVIFINDFPTKIDAPVYMFADDTKVYRSIKDEGDIERLQRDFDELDSWSRKFLLRFHPEKCMLMILGRTETPTTIFIFTIMTRPTLKNV